MIKIFITLLLYFTWLSSEEIIVVADKSFDEQNLTKKEIRAIFLDKKRFIKGKRILVMNYEYNHPLRLCFEKNILEKTSNSLERYWRRAYYQGKRPPKVVKSIEMLFSFFEKVQPSIGYIDANISNDSNITILYKVNCSTI